MPDRLARLEALERRYDGPIPAAMLAAALGGAGRNVGSACERMARDAVAAAGRRRRGLSGAAAPADPALCRLAESLAWSRAAALSARADG